VTLYAKWVETPVFEDTVEGDLIALLPMEAYHGVVGCGGGLGVTSGDRSDCSVACRLMINTAPMAPFLL